MKKLFFTALVAVVAIGGAFATNSSKVFTDYHYNDGTCHTISTLPDGCGSGPDICTVNGATLFDGSCASPATTAVQKAL